MGIAYNARMPTSGLVLALDCANPKSYSPNVFGYALDIYSWVNAATGDLTSDYYRLYKNGYDMSLPYPTGGSQGPYGISIGATGWDTEYGNGEFSFVYVYNRVLSASEILKTFNAHRSRFNI